MRFNHKAFSKWENDTHIPTDVMNMVNFIAEKIGCGEIEEETIKIYNRGGYVIGYAKGFSITHCTFSFADGPSVDYSEVLERWLKGLDFRIENSYGDNGLDPASSYGRDTYWTHEFIYKPTEVWEERFIEYDEEDYEE